jgi:hypothetical protein
MGGTGDAEIRASGAARAFRLALGLLTAGRHMRGGIARNRQPRPARAGVDPATANGVFYDAFLREMSRDGKRVFFLTGRGLVPEDNDSPHDVYERSGGVTKLISTGNEDNESHYTGMSEDESTIFVSYPGLYSSIYAYENGTRTQVAPNGVSLTTFEGSSADGSRVFFGTAERLVPADLDSDNDAGQNNSPGDPDDRVFAQQGIYIP